MVKKRSTRPHAGQQLHLGQRNGANSGDRRQGLLGLIIESASTRIVVSGRHGVEPEQHEILSVESGVLEELVEGEFEIVHRFAIL
jgi:hypothetical protein